MTVGKFLGIAGQSSVGSDSGVRIAGPIKAKPEGTKEISGTVGFSH